MVFLYVDILCVDANGGITLAECKLASHPEAKRGVVAQLLEYAALLWKKPYGHLDELVMARAGKRLATLMEEKLAPEAPASWREEFEKSVAENLDTGNFRLVTSVQTDGFGWIHLADLAPQYSEEEVRALAEELSTIEGLETVRAQMESRASSTHRSESTPSPQ